MALRTIVDERDARSCLVAAARSGLTMTEWARRESIDGRSLHAWQRRLVRAAPPVMVPATLVEVVPVPAGAMPRRYLVRIGDAEVEVGDDFDTEMLRRIVEALRAC